MFVLHKLGFVPSGGDENYICDRFVVILVISRQTVNNPILSIVTSAVDRVRNISKIL